MSKLKTLFAGVAVLVTLSPVAQAQTPTKRVTLDIGRPENTFVLGPISRGASEYIDAALYVRGTAYPTNDLNGYMFYSSSITSTQGVYIYDVAADVINGHAYFQMSTTDSLGLSTNASDYPVTNHCEVVLTNATQTFVFDHGKLILRWDPATAGAGSATLANVTPLTSFLGSTDTPATYVGQAGKVITVNTGETAVEFTNVGAGDITGVIAGTDLTGGGLSGTVTLNADTNSLAQRLWVTGQGYLTSEADALALADAFAVSGRVTTIEGTYLTSETDGLSDVLANNTDGNDLTVTNLHGIIVDGAAGGFVGAAKQGAFQILTLHASENDQSDNTSGVISLENEDSASFPGSATIGSATNAAGLIQFYTGNPNTVRVDINSSGVFDLKGNPLTNAVLDAGDITVGTVPLAALANIDETDLDASVNASLALADSSLQSYTETDPEWTLASNSFLRLSGGAMAGNINLNAFTLDNGIVDADQLTTGTVPAAAYGATAGTTNAITSAGLVDISALLGGGAADGGATNIQAGATDSYDVAGRTLTWNTNAAAQAAATGAGDTFPAWTDWGKAGITASVSLVSGTWTDLKLDDPIAGDSSLFNADGSFSFSSTGLIDVVNTAYITAIDITKSASIGLEVNGGDRIRGILFKSSVAAGLNMGGTMFRAYNDNATNKWRVVAWSNSTGANVVMSDELTHTTITRWKNAGE